MIKFILACTILWALLFGFNVGGKHYGMSCGSNGVTLEGA
jgi:hypothetical protein